MTRLAAPEVSTAPTTMQAISTERRRIVTMERRAGRIPQIARPEHAGASSEREGCHRSAGMAERLRVSRTGEGMTKVP